MWQWARDQKIIDAFALLTDTEAKFLAFVAASPVLISLIADGYQWNDMTKNTVAVGVGCLWWMALGVLFVSKNHLLSFTLHEIDGLFEEAPRVDRRIYVALGAVAIFCFLLVGVSGRIFLSLMEAVKANIPKSFLFGTWAVIEQEIRYRFILYYSMNRFVGRKLALTTSVFIFSFSHTANPFYPIAVMPAGMLFNLVTILSGSLLPAVILHFIINTLFYFFLAR